LQSAKNQISRRGTAARDDILLTYPLYILGRGDGVGRRDFPVAKSRMTWHALLAFDKADAGKMLTGDRAGGRTGGA